MIWIFAIGAVAVSVFLSAFYSGAETGLYCANRARLHLKVRQGDPQAVRLSKLLADEGGTLTATLIGVNVMDYITTTATAFLFFELLKFSETKAEFYTVAVVAPFLFVFCNVVPKNLYQMHADRFMLLSSRLLDWSSRLFRATGAVWCLRKLADWVNRWTVDPVPDLLLVEPKRKVATMLRDSLAAHALGPVQSRLIEQVLQLSEMSVQSVMVSAGRVTAIAGTATRDELIRVAKTTSHSRLPVFGTHRRRIIGLIHIDELLGTQDWKTVASPVEPALTIGPYETITSALTLLQSAQKDMAVVADKDGTMLGIVTLRTLLDVIIGGLAVDD